MATKSALYRELSERELDVLTSVKNQWGTRLSIARALGMSKHPALIKVIEDMVTDGFLQRHLDETNKKTPIYFYLASDNE